jgi:hypothetical protein
MNTATPTGPAQVQLLRRQCLGHIFMRGIAPMPWPSLQHPSKHARSLRGGRAFGVWGILSGYGCGKIRGLILRLLGLSRCAFSQGGRHVTRQATQASGSREQAF